MQDLVPEFKGLFANLSEFLLVAGVAGATALVGWAKVRLETWWKDRSLRRFERSINQNFKVRELLAELRGLYKADRVCLWQMHNGDHYNSGESIMKCSMTHYVTRTGVAAPPASQNILTSYMVLSLKSLQETPGCRFEAGQIVGDSLLDSLFTTTGNQVVLATPVRDGRRNWTGILCVSWIDDPVLPETGSDDLLNYADQVGQFLSRRNR